MKVFVVRANMSSSSPPPSPASYIINRRHDLDVCTHVIKTNAWKIDQCFLFLSITSLLLVSHGGRLIRQICRLTDRYFLINIYEACHRAIVNWKYNSEFVTDAHGPFASISTVIVAVLVLVVAIVAIVAIVVV